MSDEKLSALDQRVTQLVTMTGKLIETVTNLAEQQNKFAEEQRITSGRLDDAIRIILEQNKKQDEFAEEQKRLAKEQQITSGKLGDVIKVMLEKDKKDEEFRNKTNENFVKLREENKVINRKVEWATTTSLDADKRVEALEVRVAQLEQKIAA